MKAQGIGEFFSTLLYSVSDTHKDHLSTGKYSDHKALNDFYDDAPEIIDEVVEIYQGIYGKVKIGEPDIKSDGDSVKYLEELREYTISSRDELVDPKDTELVSKIDDFLSLIDTTLYKLKELKENRKPVKYMNIYEKCINLKSIASYIQEKCDEQCKNKECEGKECEDKDCKEKKIMEEGEVTDEKSFREYAEVVLKEIHGEDYDQDKAKEVIDGILNDYKEDVDKGDWGKLIGIINKGTK